MVRSLGGEEPGFIDPNNNDVQIREYIKTKAMVDSFDARLKELREALFARLDRDGEEDSNGNIRLEFDTPIDGVVRLEKQLRTSRKLDELVAEAIISGKGLEEKLYKTVKVIDEDAVMAAHFEGELTEDEIDSMFPVTVTWALRIPKK